MTSLPLRILAVSGSLLYLFGATPSRADDVNPYEVAATLSLDAAEAQAAPQIALARIQTRASNELEGKRLVGAVTSRLRAESWPAEIEWESRETTVWLPLMEDKVVTLGHDQFRLALYFHIYPKTGVNGPVYVAARAVGDLKTGHRPPGQEAQLREVWRAALELKAMREQMQKSGRPTALIVLFGDLSSFNSFLPEPGFEIRLYFGSVRGDSGREFRVQARTAMDGRPGLQEPAKANTILEMRKGLNCCEDWPGDPLCRYFEIR